VEDDEQVADIDQVPERLLIAQLHLFEHVQHERHRVAEEELAAPVSKDLADHATAKLIANDIHRH